MQLGWIKILHFSEAATQSGWIIGVCLPVESAQGRSNI
jgi:hypothetical protein